MQGLKRRIIHSVLFEIIGLLLLLAASFIFFTGDAKHLGALAITLSLVAMFWNFVFNKLFEKWETRQVSHTRTLKRRAVHALFFEGGLAVVTLPLIMWVLNLSLWQAIAMDIGFILFYLVYALIFNWCFDRVFGVPKLEIMNPPTSVA